MSTDPRTHADDIPDEPYAPTDDEVRSAYTYSRYPEIEQGVVEWDRWLAEHDRQVAARVLRQAVESICHAEQDYTEHTRCCVPLLERADSIAAGEPS